MTVLLFARDAGGANIVRLLAPHMPAETRLVAKDYARAVFARHGEAFLDFNATVLDRSLGKDDIGSIRAWIAAQSGLDLVITGTSHFDDWTDRLIWTACAERGLPTIAVLDQWLRIEERFTAGGQTIRPDHVLAPNEEIAQDLRRRGLPRRGAFCLGHPHLAELWRARAEIVRRREAARRRIEERFQRPCNELLLFASEPFRRMKELGTGFAGVEHDELSVFRFLSGALAESARRASSLLVKLHPKEDPRGFEAEDALVADQAWDPLDLIAAADLVIGIKSMLLIEAAVLGRPVLSIDLWGIAEEELVTNRLGVTRRIGSRDDLMRALSETGLADTALTDTAREALGLFADWPERLREAVRQALDSRVG